MVLSDDCHSDSGALFDSSDDEFADVVHAAASLSRRQCRVQRNDERSENQPLMAAAHEDAHLTSDGQDNNEDDEEDLSVTVAMALLVICLLAFLGYVGYHVATSETYSSDRLPSRQCCLLHEFGCGWSALSNGTRGRCR